MECSEESEDKEVVFQNSERLWLGTGQIYVPESARNLGGSLFQSIPDNDKLSVGCGVSQTPKHFLRMEGEISMRVTKKVMVVILSMVIVFCSALVPDAKKVSAEATDIYQVNGKYSLSNDKLVTKCRLETADSGLKKKTRVYKITSKTKFYQVRDDDSSKKLLKGSKLKKAIKTANKKNTTIQFKEKNGRVIFVWFI